MMNFAITAIHGDKILKALGLPVGELSKVITSATLHMDAQSIITLDVTYLVQEEGAEELIKVLEKYALVERG